MQEFLKPKNLFIQATHIIMRNKKILKLVSNSKNLWLSSRMVRTLKNAIIMETTLDNY